MGEREGEVKMNRKTLFICLMLVSVVIVGITVAVIMKEKEQETNECWVIASEDELLGKYEKSDLLFNRDVTDDKIIYWHDRKIDGAIVEKDFINYQFDKDTKELIKKTVRWRDDLPEHLPPIITKEEAEAMVGGKIMYTNLWFISPESHIFSIKPTPKNPCWAVSIADDRGYNTDVIVIDAVEGKVLGHGVPFP